ncbi:MAG: hypothetical protein QOC63_2269 [Mycobacterium sp.]|jgi:hypothetical protein|nr:hypothetical protein [Mycobacterium sp.]
MTTALIFLIVSVPFAVPAALALAAHRSETVRFHLDQFKVAAPEWGRLFDDDRDAYRIEHDVDAIRTRFEKQPFWPSSGATGERR